MRFSMLMSILYSDLLGDAESVDIVIDCQAGCFCPRLLRWNLLLDTLVKILPFSTLVLEKDVKM